jgi:hypothetical protein
MQGHDVPGHADRRLLIEPRGPVYRCLLLDGAAVRPESVIRGYLEVERAGAPAGVPQLGAEHLKCAVGGHVPAHVGTRLFVQPEFVGRDEVEEPGMRGNEVRLALRRAGDTVGHGGCPYVRRLGGEFCERRTRKYPILHAVNSGPLERCREFDGWHTDCLGSGGSVTDAIYAERELYIREYVGAPKRQAQLLE